MIILGVTNLYAIPNHLRPSTSYRALTKGQFETPKTFKDRIYLTDVAETLTRVILSECKDADIKVQWRKGYFPWQIKIKMYGGTLELTGKLYGDTSWSSAILLQFKNLEDVFNSRIKNILELFVSKLGRLPYESPYWTEDTWQEFLRIQKISRKKMESDWVDYINSHD